VLAVAIQASLPHTCFKPVDASKWELGVDIIMLLEAMPPVLL